VFLEARRNIDPRHATKWSRPNGSKRLGGKSASQGRFSESHITNQRRRSGRGGFSTDSTLAIGGGSLAQAQCLFRRLLAYSYSNDLGLYAEEIDGRTGDAQAVFRAIFVLCISSVDELSGPWRHRFLPFPLS